MKSYLELIQACDRLPQGSSTTHLYRLHFAPFPATTFGYILPSTITQLTTSCPTLLTPPFFTLSHKSRTLTLLPTTPGYRSSALLKFFLAIKQKGLFPSLLERLDENSECLPIYGPTRECPRDIVASIPKEGRSVLGVMGYGVQLICYERSHRCISPTSETHSYPFRTNSTNGVPKPAKGDIEAIYIARRSKTKKTFPGMLDNTVGGTIKSGETPLECLIREAGEEASIPASVIRSRATPCATIKYITYTGEIESNGGVGEKEAAAGGGRDSVDGIERRERRRREEDRFVDPEVQFVFEMEMDGDVPSEARLPGAGEEGLLRPSTQFVYEMEVNCCSSASEDGEGQSRRKMEEFVLEPRDGEVEMFMRFSVSEVSDALRREEFPPAIAMVVVEFLVRWGVLDKADERDFVEICRRLKRGFEFPVMPA